jgi:hypothetical protein
MMSESNDLATRGDETEVIDGGYVEALEDLPFQEAKHRAETARKMAFLLVWIMAASVAVDFVGVATFAAFKNTTAIESLGKIFNMWLPVISGLVSSAATYYFTRENQK